jgi:aryl-alcohol dehydrogenase-like predicted oxidoreductase
MRYIKLGSTGLDISPIAIGAMTYGEPDRGHPAWSLGEDDSRPLIKHALDTGATRAQIALAWLRRNPVVAAPLVGASSTTQIDDAVASLDIDLTDHEAAALEAHYTPRHDFQGISDDAEFARSTARIPGFTPAGA